MVVYIEYVVINNMVIDLIIIYLTLRLMRLRVSVLRVVLCAMLGTAFAILVSLLSLSAYIMLGIKLASGLLLVALMAGYRGLWQYFKTFAMFMAVTLFLGGGCFFALFLLSGSIEQAIVLGYDGVPIGIVILPIALTITLTSSVVKRVKRLRHTQPFYYRLEIEVDGECISTTGYLDSGNLLYDLAGNPIIVADRELFSQISAKTILRGGRLGSVPISTASGVGSMKTCSTDKLVIYCDSCVNILYNITVGLADYSFDGFSCLLHPAVV